MTNHKKLIDVTGAGLPLFWKRKGILKIDHSVKMPRYRLSVGVACSNWSAPAVKKGQIRYVLVVCVRVPAVCHLQVHSTLTELPGL